MKISANAWYDAHPSEICTAEPSISVLAEAGFDAVDLAICEFGNQAELQKSGKLEKLLVHSAEFARAKGMQVGQVHLPYLYTSLPVPGEGDFEIFVEEFLSVVVGAIEITSHIGCNLAVLHPVNFPSLEQTRTFNKQILDYLAPVIARTGVTIAVENCVRNIASSDELLAYAKYGAEKGISLCLDTGHIMLAGENPVDVVYKYGKHLAALHVNNNAGTQMPNRDFHMLPGDMRECELTDWFAFCRALEDVGYAGTYNLEIVRPYTKPGGYFPSACYRGFYSYAATVARLFLENTNG